MILAISLVLIIVLFPIWPFTVKYGLWLISLVLLVALLGIIILRLIVYTILVNFNYYVWIFPNLLNSNEILECFLPIIEITKGDKGWFNLFIRLFAISAFVLMCIHIYQNPTFFDGNFYPI